MLFLLSNIRPQELR